MSIRNLLIIISILIIFGGTTFIVLFSYGKQPGNTIPSPKNENIDLANALWIGTQRGGLYISPNQNDFQHVPSIPNDAEILDIQQAYNGVIAVVTRQDGIFFSLDRGKNFTSKSNGLPHKHLIIDGSDNIKYYRELVGFSMDKSNPKSCFAATKYSIYQTDNGGDSWEKYGETDYIDISAFTATFSPFRLAIGTGFNGLYLQTEQDGKFTVLQNALWSVSSGEPISVLSIDPGNPDILYIGFSFKSDISAIFMTTDAAKAANKIAHRLYPIKIPMPKHPQAAFSPYGIAFNDSSMGSSIAGTTAPFESKLVDYNASESLYVTSADQISQVSALSDNELLNAKSHAVWNNNIDTTLLEKLFRKGFIGTKYPTILVETKQHQPILKLSSLEKLWKYSSYKDKSPHHDTADAKNALYLPTHHINNTQKVDRFLAKIKGTPINAIIFDIKDDVGNILYKSDIELASEIGAQKNTFNLKPVVAYLKQNNVYTIARMVVFKDMHLFHYDNGKYAIWDSATKAQWKGLKKEFWLDPFSDFIWKYIINICKELLSLGVDEIQFDYIRFPTDKLTDTMVYRYQRKGMERKDAIESFLYNVRKEIQAPISVDIYGEWGWYNKSTGVAQELDMLKNYVDVISPMYYPSHFNVNFLNFPPYEKRPYRIYYSGTLRPREYTNDRILLRPYLQAFCLKKSNSYDAKYCGTGYVLEQIKACRDASSGGTSWWHSGGNYEMTFDAYALFR